MDLHSKLKNLKEKAFFSSLIIERGIEKESLRVSQEGFVSQSNHPLSLGSSYTNPSITTDFAEALVEIVTPIFHSVEELHDNLFALHVFIANGLENNEMLWPYSIPPRILDESKINIATYSKSNMGQLKHIYRKGLAVRYGKTMQCVSGIHYNFSLSEESLSKLIGTSDQKDITNAYLGLIRNFKRIFWFVLSEYGNSAQVDKTFVTGRENDLDVLNDSDLFKENATSLRMSEIGYQSSAQKNLNIKYNDLDEFLDELRLAIITPYPEFEELGLKDKQGNFQQISNGILQIENELYDCIRPKRAGSSGERPYELLKNQGIKYVEVRGIDLCPNEITGISKNQMRVLDLILLYCLFEDSPLMGNEEKLLITANDNEVIKNGRNPDAEIFYKNSQTSISSARTDIVDCLISIASNMKDGNYLKAAKGMKKKKNTFDKNISFHDAGTLKAKQNLNYLKSLNSENNDTYQDEAKKSIMRFNEIQKESIQDMDDFMNSYNSKL